ncbi:LysM peptidoglycan-binding domain-containing protein [Pullulanibacillus sp. KACC 23026]|uniref:LysM peptidoglycan-binding domain-containing protein n=1 Tax=Pullulanibacillus sp. KACC 23026 TaxID=3028315 RepID=UPI0023AFF8E8|nr:LysM peptidoglycan-binding domain-containing protein [Pullulanibacillus sp. KACC 23026]WEG14065.1 LysM peptidoglycan-binding domain-containing protein [Pullulanibacillus sp. KACC 23026]
MKIYIVQKGDTAQKIAQKHGVSLSALKQFNTQLELDQIKPGMKMKIPTEAKPVRRNSAVEKKKELGKKNEAQSVSSKKDRVLPSEENEPIAISLNSYTYKPDPYKAPSMPHQDVAYEIPSEGMSSSSVIEDPFPDAMKEKESQNGLPEGTHTAYQETGYPFQQGTPNPYYGYPNYPYTGTQPSPTPQFGTAGPEGEAYQGGELAGNSYYDYAPSTMPPDYIPYRDSFGCQAPQTDYYYDWSVYQDENQRAYPAEGYAPPSTYPYYNYSPESEGEFSGTAQSGYSSLPFENNQASVPFNQENQSANPSSTGVPFQNGQMAVPSANPSYNQENYPNYAMNPSGEGFQSGSYEPYPNPAYQSAEPYPKQPYQPNGTYPAYGSYPIGSSTPDYAMWESYVDYHEPPYQPDFPLPPNKK